MAENNVIFGLDLGVASVGWSVMNADAEGNPVAVHAAGASIFSAGTDGSLNDIARGRDTPKNAQRQLARSMRRQLFRRRMRLRAILRELIAHKLLPTPEPGFDPHDGAQLHDYLQHVDQTVRAGVTAAAGKLTPADAHALEQTWPYHLRRAAVVGQVSRFELGRALYHMAQRRGFKSNRKTDGKGSDEEKEQEELEGMKLAIAQLEQQVQAHKPSTLGAYLASLDPDTARLRGRRTSRALYESEFKQIMARQAAQHDLAPDAVRAIHKAIFFQRPLRSQAHLIGKCSLVKSARRAPLALREVQEFRIYDKLANLRLAEPGRDPRSLTPAELEPVASALSDADKLTFTQLTKLLGLAKKTTFNLAGGDDEKFVIGHRTDAKLIKALGDEVAKVDRADFDSIVSDLRSFRDQAPMMRRFMRRFDISEAVAEALSAVKLEAGNASLSLEAIRRLMPLLRAGTPLATARKAEFPEVLQAGAVAQLLPKVTEWNKALRNPGVERVLSELRKVVNTLIRQYGRPSSIRVELARDLKNPRKKRAEMTKRGDDRSKLRDKLKARIIAEGGVIQPSDQDIQKALLWQECDQQCPYTGKAISFAALFGSNSQFDIEHIWPRSRCLDDSMANKTLCCADFNRSRKRNLAPCEVFLPGSPDEQALLVRVRAFKADFALRAGKVRRFTSLPDQEFSNRHLSDTRYATRLAADYLGLLFGGRVDAEGKQRILTPTGGVTAWLRTGWGIDRLLGASAGKNRDDHRHHAIDAIVIALSDQRAINILSRAAEQAEKKHQWRAFEQIEEPWPNFRAEVDQVVSEIRVYHKPSRAVNGPLHNETVYGQRASTSGGQPQAVQRTQLGKLTAADFKDGKIRDPRALKAIIAKLTELGFNSPEGTPFAAIFGDSTNLPIVRGHNGKPVRLTAVRINEKAKPISIGAGPSQRMVATAGNHHTVIWEVTQPASKGKLAKVVWDDEPVTMLECTLRLERRKTRQRELARQGVDAKSAKAQAMREHPVIDSRPRPGQRFVCSLCPGDLVTMNHPREPDGESVLFELRSVSKGDYIFILATDARTMDEIKIDKAAVRIRTITNLRTLNMQKVQLSVTGEMRYDRS